MLENGNFVILIMSDQQRQKRERRQKIKKQRKRSGRWFRWKKNEDNNCNGCSDNYYGSSDDDFILQLDMLDKVRGEYELYAWMVKWSKFRSFESFTLTALLKIDSGDGNGGILFRATSVSNIIDYGQHYYFDIDIADHYMSLDRMCYGSNFVIVDWPEWSCVIVSYPSTLDSWLERFIS